MGIMNKTHEPELDGGKNLGLKTCLLLNHLEPIEWDPVTRGSQWQPGQPEQLWDVNQYWASNDEAKPHRIWNLQSIFGKRWWDNIHETPYASGSDRPPWTSLTLYTSNQYRHWSSLHHFFLHMCALFFKHLKTHVFIGKSSFLMYPLVN